MAGVLHVDNLQDAFAAAIGERRKYRLTGSLDAWIWRIVVNRAISERRRVARTAQCIPAARDDGAPDHDHDGPTSRIAARLVQLPERQRLAVFLRYYADLDYAAIGAVLGISSGTVGASLHRAHETLRAALAPEEART